MFIPGPPKGASSTIFSLLTVHSSLSRVVQLYLGILVVMHAHDHAHDHSTTNEGSRTKFSRCTHTMVSGYY